MKDKDVKILKYLNKATDELIVWLFDTNNNKRYIIEKALKMVYLASREQTVKEILKEVNNFKEKKAMTLLTKREFEVFDYAVDWTLKELKKRIERMSK